MRHVLPSACASVLAWSLLAACGPGEPPTGRFAGLSSQPDGGTEADASAAGDGGLATAFTPDGIWVLWTETSACVDMVAGSSFESLSHTIEHVTMSDRGGGAVSLADTPCWIDLSPVLGMKTAVPQALVDAIPVKETVGVLGGTAVGDRLYTQSQVETWGVHLDDPFTDPLPTAASDPRVFDMDGDGLPGVTLTIGTDFCTVQVVQRAVITWDLAFDSPGSLSGGGSSRSEQAVLSASQGLCASSQTTRPNPRHDRFRLVRVDGKNGAMSWDDDNDGTVTCAELVAHRSDLFTYREARDVNCGR